MKKLLQEYANYNHWANKQFTDVIMNLPDAQVYHNTKSSFSNIYKTLLHLWDAEAIWWQRINLADHVVVPSTNFSGGLVQLVNELLLQNKHWYEFIEQSTENALLHVFMYSNSKKEQFKQPVCEVLIHVFNHQSFHRGQLVTMLRELDVAKIPHSGFIEFTRSK